MARDETVDPIFLTKNKSIWVYVDSSKIYFNQETHDPITGYTIDCVTLTHEQLERIFKISQKRKKKK